MSGHFAPAKYATGQVGEPCIECSEPYGYVVKVTGHFPDGDHPVGPANVECPNGHTVLREGEPIAEKPLLVWVED